MIPIELPESLIKVLEYMCARTQRVKDILSEEFLVLMKPHDVVFRGDKEDMADDLGYALSTVHSSLRTLQNLGVIQQIKNRSRYGLAVYWIKKTEINAKEYSEYVSRNTFDNRLSEPSKWTRMQDSLSRLASRIAELETRLERLEHVQDDEIRASRQRNL